MKNVILFALVSLLSSACVKHGFDAVTQAQIQEAETYVFQQDLAAIQKKLFEMFQARGFLVAANALTAGQTEKGEEWMSTDWKYLNGNASGDLQERYTVKVKSNGEGKGHSISIFRNIQNVGVWMERKESRERAFDVEVALAKGLSK